MDTFKELYESHKESLKGLMVSLRNKDNMALLIKDTDSLPESISASERLYCWINGLTEIPKCPVCGNPRVFNKLNKGYFSTCGSKDCKSALISKANKESYRDWDAIQEKMRATYAANHNGYTHNMKDPEFKEKFFERYKDTHNGESCGVQSKKAIENREATFKSNGGIRKSFEKGIIEKYGSLSECAKANNMKRSKIKSEKDLAEIRCRLSMMGYEYIEESNYIVSMKCSRCGNIFQMSRQAINTHYRNNSYNFCSICDFKEMTFRSHFEKEIGQEIKKFYNGNMQFNKYINGLECDIVIPDKMIAIEANGCYWHTEQYKSIDAHIEKKKKVEDAGYNLIQIWEDDWNDKAKHDIIISRLKSKFGMSEKVYARKCILKDVAGKEAKAFLENNHIQGYIPSTYKFGLYYNGELLEIITLGNSRKAISGNNDSIELYRLCTKQGYNVIGGFSRLLKHAASIIKGPIISYADCDWCSFNSNGYEKVGFEKIKMTEPGYTYNIDGIRKNRLNYTKSKLVGQGFDKSKSEIEIMHDRGYYRIYNSGNILFRYSN